LNPFAATKTLVGSRTALVGATAAAALGALALANRAAARRTERKHPPEGGFIGVDGVRLHYSDRGTGPRFNWPSQHLSALIAAPLQELRLAFSSRASCAASR